MEKLYCYVDETGQDTKGDLFIVSVIVTEAERDKLREQLEEIERITGKGRRKWMKSRPKQKAAYIESVLQIPALKGKLNYAVYHKTIEYLSSTILTTARAITTHSKGEYKVIVFVDGLPKSKVQWFGSELRHLRIRTEKVRGVRKEEADPLMRLADAIAGFVRAALLGSKDMVTLLEKAKREGHIREL